MRTLRIALFAALAMGSLIAAPAGAALLVDHPFGEDAGYCTPCDADYRMWDSFDLSDTSTISSIDARLDIEPSSFIGAVTFSIWTADRSEQLFSQAFGLDDLSLVQVTSNEYFHDATANFSLLQLAAGTYALSIFGDSFLGWVESSLTTFGRSVQSPEGGGSGLDMSFRVNGDPVVVSVPEPGTISLLAAGLLGIVLIRRRRPALQPI